LSESILSRKNIQKNKLGQSTSKKQLKIFKFEEKIPAFSARLSVLITFSKFLKAILFFLLSDSILSQKNIQKNKLGQRNSKKQLKIFKFEDKISAFGARLSVLITVFEVSDSNSFF
jgi:hypothetical protein